MNLCIVLIGNYILTLLMYVSYSNKQKYIIYKPVRKNTLFEFVWFLGFLFFMKDNNIVQ